jgi:hypothetical protein
MGSSRGGITPLVRKHYRVLPSVSRRYPRPQGRFPCCPLPFAAFLYCYILARLACLIHAANVHSEPGSNPSLVVYIDHPALLPNSLIKLVAVLKPVGALWSTKHLFNHFTKLLSCRHSRKSYDSKARPPDCQRSFHDSQGIHWRSCEQARCSPWTPVESGLTW